MAVTTIVISDLHLGAGPGDPLEDFTSDEIFARWLGEVRAEAEAQGNEVRLLINGDMFEFLQVPATDFFQAGTIYPESAYRPMGEAPSLQKLELMIRGHPTFFDALKAWVQPAEPPRTLTLLAGNHDPQLFWPAVRRRLHERLGATNETLTFSMGYWMRDGVYVEHGHQYAEHPNRFPSMEPPFVPDQPDELFVPPGSHFVLAYFNQLEAQRPWVDGVKPITALVWYALQFDFVFAARALAALFRVLPDVILPRALDGEAEGAHAARLLTHESPNQAQLRAWARRYERDPAFKAEFDAFMAASLDVAAASTLEPAVRGVVPRVLEAPGMLRGQQEQLAQRSALIDAAETIATDTDARVVCFGHTHAAQEVLLPSGARYINTGTWIWSADMTSWSRTQWADLFANPDRYSHQRWLTYARIDHAEDGTPRTARLLAVQGQAPTGGGNGPEGCLRRLFGG